MYLKPHSYRELDHPVRDSLLLSLRINVSDDYGSSDADIHLMDLLCGDEITSLFTGLLR